MDWLFCCCWCCAAAKQFPLIDGRELIPIGEHVFGAMGCASFDQYLQNFLAVPYEMYGQYYDRDTDPEYIRWLKAFRELGAEGYLKEDIFIDKRTQMEEKMEQGRYFCMLYQRTDMENQQKSLYHKNPDSIYMALDGPKNSRGDDPVLPSAGINGWTVTLISKNCERPDRAIEFLTYLMSEKGQRMIYYGVEGVTYDLVDGAYVVKPEVQRLPDTDRVEYDRLYGASDTYWMFQNTAMQLAWRQQHAQIRKNVDAINMSTQFFLNDQALHDFLVELKQGRQIPAERLNAFYHEDIASMERMVNSNLYLYQIRVYADQDNMQEIMPILYTRDRMSRLSWAQDEPLHGWKLNYADAIFDSYAVAQNSRIMSLVTPIEDFENGELAVLEVSMKMDTMFEGMYRANGGLAVCFVDESGSITVRRRTGTTPVYRLPWRRGKKMVCRLRRGRQPRRSSFATGQWTEGK